MGRRSGRGGSGRVRRSRDRSARRFGPRSRRPRIRGWPPNRKRKRVFTDKQPGAKRVALVGCAALKSKRPAPAKDFYTSALFRAAYKYAEKTCDAVIIVSAFYGAVAPKTVLQPYDRNL